jgi:hypothetical protein
VIPRPPACDRHAQLLFESFARVVGRPLCTPVTTFELAEHLWRMPQVLVSHGLEEDPLFNYGNAAGLALFEMTWAQFIATPSRKSAEPLNQDARAKVMTEVATRGFVAGYSGVRIAQSGRRFRIEDTVIWNVIDADGAFCGQAATFARWTPLP